MAGADRVVEQLLTHSSGRVRFTVYLVRTDAAVLVDNPTAHFVYLPAFRGKYLRAPSYFLLSCFHYLVKCRSDVAHVHNSDFGAFCLLLRLRRRVRIIGTFHGDPAKREKWNRFAKWCLRGSEAVFVRTCDVLTSVSAEKVVSRRPVHYIPNGTDPFDRAPAVPTRAALPSVATGDSRFVMFACGRLDRTKGLHHLVDAYRELNTALPLLVVADFSHDATYSAAIRRAGSVDERVHFHDALLDRESLFEVMRRCAVFVFPSEIEGMSMVLLEAVTHAGVVVCSDIEPNLEVVGRDFPFLFRSRDSAALRSVLEDALDASATRPDLRRVRERLFTTFRWDRIAHRYEALYGANPHAPRAPRAGRTIATFNEPSDCGEAGLADAATLSGAAVSTR
jgi:glycosyltransferase involved in cell wall biosynthesis